MNFKGVLGVTAMSAAISFALPAAAATYTITALAGGNACAPTYISDASKIVGVCNGTAVAWTLLTLKALDYARRVHHSCAIAASTFIRDARSAASSAATMPTGPTR